MNRSSIAITASAYMTITAFSTRFSEAVIDIERAPYAWKGELR
jgi:hypothetical protein